jgi:hypothetical protein
MRRVGVFGFWKTWVARAIRIVPWVIGIVVMRVVCGVL